jgi:long-chain fatty acid transport protein
MGIKDHPAYYTGSLEYTGRNVSYFLSYTTAHTLENDLEYNLQFSQLDTLVPTKFTREIDIPATMVTGVNYRFMKRHNVMFDFMLRGWDENIANLAGGWNLADSTETQTEFLAAIGYQRDGSTVIYDKFWEKNTYRLGAWVRNWYISDVIEYGAALGIGISWVVGGTQVDIALQGGLRESENDSFWDEKFVGITLGLTGVGTWGQNPPALSLGNARSNDDEREKTREENIHGPRLRQNL